VNTRHLAFVALLVSTPAAATTSPITLTLTTDTPTSILVGQSVTFTVALGVDYPALWAQTGLIGIRVGTSLGPILSGDGQQSFSAPAIFTYSMPGTYYPSVNGSYSFVGEYTLAATGDELFSCTPCGGYGSLGATGPAITVAAVPEPMTWAMLLTGFALLGGWRWRSRHSVQKS
jgi:hypothetical protein